MKLAPVPPSIISVLFQLPSTKQTHSRTLSFCFLWHKQTSNDCSLKELKFSSCDAIKRKQKRNNWCECRFGGNGDADASSDHREVIISLRAVEDFSPGWTDSPLECLQHVNELLTLLPDLQASDHLWATEQHRIITASPSASLSHHANTHS